MGARNISLQVAHSIFKTVVGQSFGKASLKRKVMAAQPIIVYNCLRYPWLEHLYASLRQNCLALEYAIAYLCGIWSGS